MVITHEYIHFEPWRSFANGNINLARTILKKNNVICYYVLDCFRENQW